MLREVKKLSMRSYEILQKSAYSEGRVHSIFPSTCNIFFSGLGFISIQGDKSFFSPLTLLLEGPLPEMKGIPLGSPVYFDRSCNTLRVHQETFDLSSAELCSCFYSYPSSAKACPTSLLNIMERIYTDSAPKSRDEFSILAYKKCYLNLKFLQKASLQGDRNAMLASSKWLIGMGQGLTPSGDDMLTGFYAAAKLNPSMRKDIDAIGPDIILHAKSATTPISYEFIRCVFENRYATVTAKVIDSICAERPEDCRLSCLELLEVGSSSGRDCLCGIICAAQLLKLDLN